MCVRVCVYLYILFFRHTRSMNTQEQMYTYTITYLPTHTLTQTNIHTHTHTHTYIYMCVWVFESVIWWKPDLHIYFSTRVVKYWSFLPMIFLWSFISFPFYNRLLINIFSVFLLFLLNVEIPFDFSINFHLYIIFPIKPFTNSVRETLSKRIVSCFTIVPSTLQRVREARRKKD